VTPIGHLGIALPAAAVARLSLPVTFFCALLPDLVDQPLWALGIGRGHYIAHSLTFAFLVAFIFLVWRRVYGLSALLGLGSHLVLDAVTGDFVPWLYPFKSYDFPNWHVDPSQFFSRLSHLLRGEISLSNLRGELILAASVIVALVLCLFIYRRLTRKKRQESGIVQPGNGDTD